jgi:hypothetical protein
MLSRQKGSGSARQIVTIFLNPVHTHAHVAITGSGIAGLSAAYELKRILRQSSGETIAEP